MVDPRGAAAPIGSGAQSPFLDALRERVLVFDGAFGTWMQGQDLGPDDFGGLALEGCNENLVLTRPDLIAQMHAEYFESGVDAVETATFGAFPLVLNEYQIADSTFEINRRAAEIAKQVAADCSTPDQPRYVIGRLILGPPAGPAAAAQLAVRRLVTGHVPATVVYHAVPTVLSGNKKLALAFERAWNARVGPGSVIYAGSPEGTGILAAQRGDDPFALTTQIRTLWR